MPRELAPVIRSKIQPPPLRSSTLTRQRLLNRLVTAVDSRLTLLVAEAGYGKTTLLADFSAHAGIRCLWFRLDSTDADAITWTNYLIAAAREVAPNFGRSTLSLLSQTSPGGPPKSVFVASLLGELSQLGEAPTLLVLDDFHSVDESVEARDFVTRLIRESPPWMHFLISSRRRPSLELARLAGMGDLVEIGTDELRFSRHETERLFAEGYGVVLEADVVHDLEARTQGWAACLQLFHGSIRGRPSSAIRALARSLSGASSPVYDFLAEEVLSNLPDALEDFLVRAALLDRILPGHVVALFVDGPAQPTLETCRQWIEEADRLGLLTRTSQSSDARQLHPLLRDFLLRQLGHRKSAQEIRGMHLRLGRTTAENDPLTACRHFIEAGEQGEAMRCLGSSVMLTMGSGQWGVASDLIDRLEGVPADPAVAAIRARRLIEEGDLLGAARLLDRVDVSASPPDVRAVFRNAKLALGWRTGDRDLLFSTLEEIQADRDTPAILRDMGQVFVDASPLTANPVTYTQLARRLRRMAEAQAAAGYSYYAAISLHNAAIVEVAAGRVTEAIRLCEAALNSYEQLSVPASEQYSTHSVLAMCWFELGVLHRAEEHIELGISTGSEHGDVPAEFAYLCALVGQRDRAERMLVNADIRQREGLSDLAAEATSTIARAFLSLPLDPERALQTLGRVTRDRPLDVGDTLAHDSLQALAHLLAGRDQEASEIARGSLELAHRLNARSAEVRLALVLAAAREDPTAIRAAIFDARSVGNLALLEVADALGRCLHLLSPVPPELEESIARWPLRWLPVLRRELQRGNAPVARAAAALLDRFGQQEDIVRLRAYAKTYLGRDRARSSLGRELAKRVGPKLQVNDLGRVTIVIGDRVFHLSGIRRKPAALLMYLVTRPSYTATREQVLDELWPDNDPVSASNSLNQSLYFLRRDIDPWYEDELSVDYVPFEGDLVWLQADLVRVASAEFLAAVREARRDVIDGSAVLQVLDIYPGQFAPEFEYEEWAIAWRSRIHAAFLEFANSSIDRLISEHDLQPARDVAVRTFEVDPDARDIERKLIWLYWALGARSAASAQYLHFASQERSDGLEPVPLRQLTESPP